MPSPPQEIMHFLSAFATALTRPAYRKAWVLLVGTILAPWAAGGGRGVAGSGAGRT